MAGSPVWKVYDGNGKYQAACKEVEAAAALVSFYGTGATIRHDHKKPVWVEGVDGSAFESYDNVVSVVYERVESRARA